MTSGPVTVQSQSSEGEEKSKDLQGNKREISYHESTNGKMKPSLRSLASPKIKGRATGTASSEIEGGATSTPTTASAKAVDPTVGVSDRSPVVSGGAEPIGKVEEEEAIGKKWKQGKKEEGREERNWEVGKFKVSFVFSPFDKPRVL